MKTEPLTYGPIRRRKCTDIFCCCLFLAFLTAYLGIGFIGFAEGEPELLLYPYDSSGNQCGRPDTATSTYDYLYYVEPSVNTEYRICLKSCPDRTNEGVVAYSNTWVRQESPSTFDLLNADNNIIKTENTLASNSFLKRFCIPDQNSFSDAFNDVLNEIRYSGIEEWATDIALSFNAILLVLLISIVISILYLILLRYCVGCILWLSILLIVVLLGAFGYYIYWTAENKYGSDQDEDTRKALKIFSYVIFGLVGLFLIILLFMCNRIRLAIAIMKSAAIFIKDVKSVMLIPVLMFMVSVLIFSYWVLALVFIYSSGTIEHKDEDNTFASVSWDDSTRNSFYFELFGIIWVNAFKISIVQFTIACCVCYWYFSPDKDIASPVCKSFYIAFRYHLGSLAFGSLVLTIIKLIKWLFYYIKHKLYKNGGENNTAVRCCCGCLGCLVRCFEKCMEFLDKHAYIQIAMTGDSFCKAAADSFALIVSNAGRFLALGSIGEIFTFIGKVFISVLSSYIGYLILTRWDHFYERIESPIPPTVIFLVVSYIIASLFMSVYDMAADSIIHAFLIDEKEGLDLAPGPLKDFISKHRDSVA